MSREVELYFENKHFTKSFPLEYTLHQIQEHIRNDPEFIKTLEEAKVQRISPKAQVEFRYNSLEGEPTQMSFRLSQFHPKKRLIFYTTITNNESPKKIKKEEPPLGIQITISEDANIEMNFQLTYNRSKIQELMNKTIQELMEQAKVPLKEKTDYKIWDASIGRSNNISVSTQKAKAKTYNLVKDKPVGVVFPIAEGQHHLAIKYAQQTKGGNR